jgi:DNA-binding NtrC family response regulator
MSDDKILVVDDEEPVRAAIVRVLSRAGMTVQGVESAEAALTVLQAGKAFQAVVTDINMPGIHGDEFLKLIRERDLDVPVIVITGNPTLESAMSVVQYGGFRYLSKPFANDELVDVVRCG